MTPYIAVGLTPVQLRTWIVKSKNIQGEERQRIIVNMVCEYFGVEYFDLTTKCRKRTLVEPRMICMWLIRKYTKLSLKNIGAMFGNRDHSTVINAVETVDDLMATGFKFAQKVRNIEKLI
mgnify:CR=1 FL=1